MISKAIKGINNTLVLDNKGLIKRGSNNKGIKAAIKKPY